MTILSQTVEPLAARLDSEAIRAEDLIRELLFKPLERVKNTSGAPVFFIQLTLDLSGYSAATCEPLRTLNGTTVKVMSPNQRSFSSTCTPWSSSISSPML